MIVIAFILAEVLYSNVPATLNAPFRNSKFISDVPSCSRLSPSSRYKFPSAVPSRPSATMSSRSRSRISVVVMRDFTLTGMMRPPRVKRGMWVTGDLTSLYSPLLLMTSWTYQS